MEKRPKYDHDIMDREAEQPWLHRLQPVEQTQTHVAGKARIHYLNAVDEKGRRIIPWHQHPSWPPTIPSTHPPAA